MGQYEKYGYDKAEGMVIAETPKALLFQEDEGGEPYWVPLSQVHEECSEVHGKGDCGILVVTEWFARKMEWI